MYAVPHGAIEKSHALRSGDLDIDCFKERRMWREQWDKDRKRCGEECVGA